MIRGARELVLAATVVALILVFTVQIRRGDQLPTPPGMMTFVAAPPPRDVTWDAMSSAARLGALDTIVQELRLETQRDAFTHALAQIATALGTFEDSPPSDLSAGNVERLHELVDETIEAIERRLEARVDEEDVQQRLAGTIYELQRRLEAINVRFEHGARRP